MQELIDALENLVNSAMRMPVGGKVLLDESALRRIIEELRSVAPDAEREDQYLAAERDRILKDAHAQARRVVEDEKAAVYERLDEQAVVQAARQRAREIQLESEKTAARLRSEADQYVLNQFNVLEQRLTRILREVQAGQHALGGGQG